MFALNSSKSPNLDGSITMYKSPLVQSLSGDAVPDTPLPYPACTNGPVNTSINKDNAYHLNPPNGKIDPFNASSGVLVGFPSASNAHPSGKSKPFLLDSMIFPRAVTDVAISTVR